MLDKHLKFKGQALLLPHVISEPKHSDLRRFALHLCLCEAAAGGIHAKNLQLGFSGSAQTNQVLWSKHRGVMVPPVWLYHDRESRLDLLPATCDMFVESPLLRSFKSLTSWKTIKAGQIFAFHLLYLKWKQTLSFHDGTHCNCFPFHYNMHLCSSMDDVVTPSGVNIDCNNSNV